TTAGTFPTDATDQLIQANVVAAKYGEARVSVNAGPGKSAYDGPAYGGQLQTFSPGSSRDTTFTFTNTAGAAVTGVELSVAVPARWTAVVRGTSSFSTVPAGSSV